MFHWSNNRVAAVLSTLTLPASIKGLGHGFNLEECDLNVKDLSVQTKYLHVLDSLNCPAWELGRTGFEFQFRHWCVIMTKVA